MDGDAVRVAVRVPVASRVGEEVAVRLGVRDVKVTVAVGGLGVEL